MDANPTTAMFLSLAGGKACLSEDTFMQWQGFVDIGNWTDYYKPTSGSGGYIPFTTTAQGVPATTSAAGAPSTTTVAPLTTTPAPCGDDSNFIDVKNYDCSGWDGSNCFALWDGYTLADLAEVQSACRMTCGLCPCEDDLSFSDHRGYDCADWAGHSCYRGQGEASYTEYTEEQLANLRRSCPSSCSLCPPV